MRDQQRDQGDGSGGERIATANSNNAFTTVHPSWEESPINAAGVLTRLIHPGGGLRWPDSAMSGRRERPRARPAPAGSEDVDG